MADPDDTVFAITHVHARILLGLASTRLADAIVYFRPELHGQPLRPVACLVHFLVVAPLLAAVWLAGRYARQGNTRAFQTGMMFYALDTLLFVFAREWIGVILHAIVLLLLARGLAASKRTNSPGPLITATELPAPTP
jgi:hypothetical protein